MGGLNRLFHGFCSSTDSWTSILAPILRCSASPLVRRNTLTPWELNTCLNPPRRRYVHIVEISILTQVDPLPPYLSLSLSTPLGWNYRPGTMKQWRITLHAETQTYWIQNVDSKKWLSTQDDSLFNSAPFNFTGVGDEIGPVHWDLRQGEWDGEF